MTPSPAVLARLHRSLEDSVGSSNVRDDAGTLVAYATDSTPLQRGRPDLVVFPGSTEEVAAVLRAGERGAGARDPTRLGNEPERRNHRESGWDSARADSDESAAGDRRGRSGRGVSAWGSDDRARRRGRRQGALVPPDPGSHTTATLGGNVAECSGGLRALKYGVTRDYVLGVEAVLATGEVIRSGGRLVKDVAGYDLRRLLCGSEGTLAVMTELTLRLVPAPETTGTGMAYFSDLADAGRAVSRVLASGVLPVTLEFLDKVCIGAVEDYAHIGLDTDAGALLDLRAGRQRARDRARYGHDGTRV